MICEKCGQWVEDGATVCSKCGAPFNTGDQQGTEGAQTGADNAYAAPTMPNTANALGEGVGPVSQPGLTKKEFFKHQNISSVKSQIIGVAVVCYFFGVINLIFGGFFDGLVILGMGVAIHIAKSRVCAVILAVLGVFEMIAAIIMTGQVGGWLILLVGIYAVIYTFKYQKAWAEYQNTGIVPDLSRSRSK